MSAEVIKKSSNGDSPPPKSLLEPRNKMFFKEFIDKFLSMNLSMTMFIFAKGYKNVRTMTDTLKLTCSDLFVYEKEGEGEMERFYYELYEVMSTSPWASDVRTELIACPGWYISGFYASTYRIKERIQFKFNHLDPNKRFCCTLMPSDKEVPLPYFAFQIVSNYHYQRVHYATVTTLALPLTASLPRLYASLDAPVTAACFCRVILSALRTETLEAVTNKLLKNLSLQHANALEAFKKPNPLPPNLTAYFQAALGLLKCPHLQLDGLDKTPAFDRLMAHRSLLQTSDHADIYAALCPYLFRLDTLRPDACSHSAPTFLYPDLLDARFANIKDGLFLMDAGHAAYLFIARTCAPAVLAEVFGTPQLTRPHGLSEHSIRAADGKGLQIATLLAVLREQKTFKWLPLHVVKCGDSTPLEQSFYLKFYSDRYDGFRHYPYSYEDFILQLNKTN